jgi:hypothetical protein
LKIPPHIIVIDAVGAIAAALGLWGALAGGGATLPFLATPRIAWSLVAIGVVLMVYSGVTLVRIARERAQRGPSEQ